MITYIGYTKKGGMDIIRNYIPLSNYIELNADDVKDTEGIRRFRIKLITNEIDNIFINLNKMLVSHETSKIIPIIKSMVEISAKIDITIVGFEVTTSNSIYSEIHRLANTRYLIDDFNIVSENDIEGQTIAEFPIEEWEDKFK